MKMLKHLRDFLNPEELKFLPGRLKAENCLFLTQSKGGKEGEEPYHTVLQVFTANGTWIGEITNPDYIPSSE